MKILKCIILLYVTFSLTACPEALYRWTFGFSNNSDTDVYIYLGVVSKEWGGTLYPDTAVTRIKLGELVKKRESRYYEYNYEYSSENTDTLSLFVFDANIFNTLSWDEIRNDYKILKRYDLTWQDIKDLNYRISYPSTEAMKNIKQYPRD